VFPNPVSNVYVIGVRLLREARSDGLLRCKEALLRLGCVMEPPGSPLVRSWQCMIPQFS
jgi:hypothetical protein